MRLRKVMTAGLAMTMCLSLFNGCGNSESNSSGAGSESTAAQESGGASDSQASDTASEDGYY